MGIREWERLHVGREQEAPTLRWYEYSDVCPPDVGSFGPPVEHGTPPQVGVIVVVVVGGGGGVVDVVVGVAAVVVELVLSKE